MGALALIFIMDVVLTSLCMYVATKFSFVRAELKPLLGIVFLVALVSLIPSIGWILGLILFVYLLTRVADANLVDCIWVVAFTKLVTVAALFVLGGILV
jgi:hypothetical protein|tara:strand:+ start:633 stop:929 length:297 start_codon:yes stop_codon:yes gene_type:complete